MAARKPAFLVDAPVLPAERVAVPVVAPPSHAGPYRSPAAGERPPPRRSASRVEPRAPIAQPLPPAPDGLARYLGPGRMPRVMMRFPRLCGIALIAFGVWCCSDILRVSEGGGWYDRRVTVMAPVGVLLGGWFVVFGRPADEHGYSPDWWNRGYIAVLVVSGIAALMIYGMYLT